MRNVTFEIAGLFISNGKGRHLTRTLTNHELIFVKSGVLHIREGERSFQVSAGQYLILHKEVEHGGTADYEKDLSFFWGHFDCPDQLLKRCHQYGRPARPDYFTQYFTLLINEQKTLANQRTCELLKEILLNETCREPADSPVKTKVSELAEGAKRIVNLHFADNISTADVAAELNCSRDYLSHVFQKTFGVSVLQCINHQRCREAAYLLRTSLSSIKEIAFFCGFNDLPHFRRQFFRKYSVTPRQYRRVHRVGNVNTMNL
ncbi:MAG: helix-turn-helix transcriptional regulator [Victivallales bacterium]|nr:helix-turn-helix transcriptional regulator [Victivallales bacterium]